MSMQTLVSPLGSLAASKTRDGWYLVGCLPPLRTLTHIKIDSPAFVIGRKAESDLQIASQCVSARHAEVLQIGPHLFLRDLGSTNGTYLNRRQVRQPTPIADGDHIEIANVEFRVEFRPAEVTPSRSDLDALKKTAQAVDVLESNWVLSQFNLLLQSREVVPSYQPIISLSNRKVIGYESLARTGLIGLENPAEMFRTAELVNREIELSLICRRKALECGTFLSPSVSLFMNTHSHESLEVDVLPSLLELKRLHPNRNLVIEIHEGAINDPALMLEFCRSVREHGFKVAYDDFGAGQSRLLELVKAPPDFLKFDACLIRDVQDSNPYQWRMLKMLVGMCNDASITTIAEGIETEAERDACTELGFDLGQGYYFGRPKPASAYPSLSDSPTRKFS